MSKTQTYRVKDADGTLLGTAMDTTPARALRQVCGDDLAKQNGRYGTLKDGRHVTALLVHGGRHFYGRGDDDHLARVFGRP
jgi:hypothetical protein